MARYIQPRHGQAHRPGGSDPMRYAVYEIKVFADDQPVETGDGKFIWAIPVELNGWRFLDVEAFVSTAGACTVQIRNVTQAVDVLSTPVTIDGGDFTSYSAATRSVVNDATAQVATADLCSVDVDVAGGQGLGVIVVIG